MKRLYALEAARPTFGLPLVPSGRGGDSDTLRWVARNMSYQQQEVKEHRARCDALFAWFQSETASIRKELGL
jgi:hypothetical protein